MRRQVRRAAPSIAYCAAQFLVLALIYVVIGRTTGWPHSHDIQAIVGLLIGTASACAGIASSEFISRFTEPERGEHHA